MLCSSCRRRISPVVAIDIDGTLADYHLSFIGLCAKYHGYDELPYWYLPYEGGAEGSFREWCKETFKITDAGYEAVKLAFRQGGYKRWLTPMDGAIDFMMGLGAFDIEIWMTTTRPYLRHDSVDPDTRYWLERYGINFHHLLYDEDKYRVLSDRVGPERVVAVLDDLPEQYDAAEVLFGPAVPILRGSPWNKNVDRPVRVADLHTAFDIIRGRIALWEEEHATEVV